MIVPLEIPPGAYRNGTEYQAKGRWRDVNLVRWTEGAMRPVGGWEAYTDDTIGQEDIARGAVAWTDAAGNKYLIWGTNSYAQVMEEDGTITDLTPAGFTAGGGSPLNAAFPWHWDTFGEIPVGCGSSDGRLWEWDLNTANNLTQITNSPTGCKGLCVTAERFIFALGDGGDPRSIRWCDRDNRTVWTAASTNQAGDWDLETEGEIMFALQMRGEVLIVTTKDAWVARYVGAPDVYEFTRIGSCSAIAMNGGVRVNDRAYWMGEQSFYVYSGGHVSELPCEVGDYVFGNIVTADLQAAAYRLKTFAWHNSDFREVWWHYQAESSTYFDLDNVVIYNYAENTWSLATAPFSTVVDRVPFPKPLGLHSGVRTGQGYVVDHEFDSDPGYTLGTNWRIAGSVLDQSAPSASQASFPNVVAISAGDYVLTVSIVNRTAGTLRIRFGVLDTTTSANGVQSFAVPASDNNTLRFDGDGTWDGDIQYVHVHRPHVMSLETGSTYEATDSEAYAKTGPLEIGDGERRAHVTQVIPDEQDAGELSLTFYAREYPTGAETTHGPYTAANPTDVRFSGRQLAMKIVQVASGATQGWRSGVHRLDVTLGGRR